MVFFCQLLVVDVLRGFSVHQLEWNLPPEALAPDAQRQMVAVKEDGVRTLHFVRAEDADVLYVRHVSVFGKPDEVDNIRDNESAVVTAVQSARGIGVDRVVDGFSDGVASGWDGGIVGCTEIHACHKTRHGDQQAPTASHSTTHTPIHACASNASQRPCKHQRTVAKVLFDRKAQNYDGFSWRFAMRWSTVRGH